MDSCDHNAAADSRGLIECAWSLRARAELNAVAQNCEKALSLKPGHPRWQGNLGAAYLAMARFEDAARCFQGALSCSPDNPRYGVSLGIALRAMGDWTGSIEVLEHALKVSSDNGPALANFVKNLEAAYENIRQRYLSGQAPADIWIEPGKIPAAGIQDDRRSASSHGMRVLR